MGGLEGERGRVHELDVRRVGGSLEGQPPANPLMRREITELQARLLAPVEERLILEGLVVEQREVSEVVWECLGVEPGDLHQEGVTRSTGSRAWAQQDGLLDEEIGLVADEVASRQADEVAHGVLSGGVEQQRLPPGAHIWSGRSVWSGSGSDRLRGARTEKDERGGSDRPALAISALALLATTPAQPTIAGRVIGEVVVGGGETVERAGKASHAAVTFWIVTISDTWGRAGAIPAGGLFTVAEGSGRSP